VALLGNVACVATLVVFAFYPVAGIGTSTVLFVLIGLFGSSFGLVIAHSRAFMPPHLMGRGVTLMNFFAIGVPGLLQFASGGVVSAAAVPGEPAAAYSMLFLFYAAMLGLALVAYLFARDAKP